MEEDDRVGGGRGRFLRFERKEGGAGEGGRHRVA